MKYLKSISLKIIFVLALVACLLNPKQLAAQSSLVPSYHPVYDWLYAQRVKGVLPDYDYESLPLQRSTILRHLRDLEEFVDDFSRSETKTLASFIEEFDPQHLYEDEPHSFIKKGQRLSFNHFKDVLLGEHERHLFSTTTDKGFLVLDHGFGKRTMFVNDNGENKSAPNIKNQHWRSYGSYENKIGYHLELIRAVPTGDKDIFEYDGFYSYNWKTRDAIQNQSNNYHWEAYTSLNYDIFELSIGRGNLKEGVGRNQNLVFSRESITTDWVKLNVSGRYLSYKFIHSTLSARSILSTLPGDSTISTKNSPRRWTAYHKLDVKPFNWLTLSFSEMINYSNRGIELAYINPVNRYAFAEWELQDQDNGWTGLSAIIRPIKKLELYGEILIDDLGNKRDILFKKEFPATSRFARRYGLTYANNSGWQISSEYTRIDPFLYSHPFELNAHSDKGIGLGSQIGPNADRLEIGVQKWGFRRSLIRIAYSYDRQGLDEFNSNGERVFLAGSDVNDGRDLPIERSNLFLDGDLHKWNRIQLDLQWEFKRAYTIRTRLEQRFMIQGSQLDDQTIFYTDLVIGF